jgi:hypothetical protein
MPTLRLYNGSPEPIRVDEVDGDDQSLLRWFTINLGAQKDFAVRVGDFSIYDKPPASFCYSGKGFSATRTDAAPVLSIIDSAGEEPVSFFLGESVFQ